MKHTTFDLTRGLFWAAAAIGIWSGSLIMLRLGVTTSLNAYDLVALRFGLAAVLLAPVILRQGFAFKRLGVTGIVTMVVGFGAPYVLLLTVGLHHAPAADAGALNPGLMAVCVALSGWALFGDPLGRMRIAGIGAILAGAALVVGLSALGETGGRQWLGDAIFAFTALMWTAYILTVRRAGIRALHATAIVAVGTGLLSLPIYVIALPKRLFDAPFADLTVQALYQGVLTGVVAVFAFNRSTEYLGTTAGACLPALIPLTTLILGALILGETATVPEAGAAVLIGLGVALTLAAQRKAASP